MRITISLICLLFSNYLFAQTILEQVRLNYITAVSDKEKCKTMIEELKTKTNQPIYLGYLGAYQAIWANHVGNPFSKLKTFNQGKDNIQKAIEEDANNVELRYLRLSIQKNVPAILGYRNMIQQDTDFLKAHIKDVTSNIVLKNIETLIKD